MGAAMLLVTNPAGGELLPDVEFGIFVWVTLAARKIWHEQVPPRHRLGVVSIISGIIILGSASIRAGTDKPPIASPRPLEF